MQLCLSRVSHRYGNKVTLAELSLSLEEGEIGALIGPSGAGKSTVLNCIAGLTPVSSGEISIGDRVVSSKGVHVPSEKRGVGLMFQDCSLFPHLSVAENIAFGLRGRRGKSGARVAELIETCRLQDLGDSRPHELSGGQQQRVALARALAPRPRLLLLDEPFSDSDAVLRASLIEEVAAAIRSEGATALLVTHDQSEAFAMADRCGVIDAGSICQWDTAYNVYHRPNCAFVASFIGEGVMIDGRLKSEREVVSEVGTIRSDRDLVTPLLRPGGSVKVLLRPDDVVLSANGGVAAKVTERSFRGADIFYTLETERGTRLLAVLPSRHDHAVGDEISVATEVEHVVVFPTVA